MINDDLSPALSLVISEAVTWCSIRPFRSPDLDPSAILGDVAERWPYESEPFEPWVERKYDSYRRAISWINHTRSRLLKAAKIEPVSVVDALTKSKLLLYWPLETVDDGASEAGSIGFYDLHDAPPWDTWLYFADRAVFCCVPQFAISRAQNGIDANPVACIEWADWSRLARVQT